MCNHKAEFIKEIESLSQSHGVRNVFTDFVTISAISIHNSVCFLQVLEDRYFSIMEKYTKDEMSRFSHLLGILIECLETKEGDFLGEVYMELNISNSNSGQFFTPYEVSRMMAAITKPDFQEAINKNGFISLSEPACGSAGMVIAFCYEMKNSGFNFQQNLWVSCVDVDHTVAYMAYLQLSLLGVAGEVVFGNILSLEFQQVLRTPFYYMFDWEGKFRVVDFIKKSKNLIKSLNNDNVFDIIIEEDSEVELDIQVESPLLNNESDTTRIEGNKNPSVKMEAVQLDFF